jgi:uncharacterized protein (DUF305 family)
MRTNRTISALGALALGLTLTLSACGSDDNANDTSTSQVSTTKHNDADVDFASDMLQHHAQALSMVDLTLDRPLDPQVQQLAEQIREAQAPEIQTFAEWLTDWDEDVPETVRDHANAGHDMGDTGDMGESTGSEMPGMMSADDMSSLEEATDSGFQTMWLEMMIEHHEGAVEMARAEQQDGQYKPAVDLATDIEKSQTREITLMRSLLDS